MSLSRRDFLLRTAVGCTGAIAGAALPGCAPDVSPAPLVDVAPPDAGRLNVAVASYPELARVGGAVRARAPGVLEPVLVVHVGQGAFVAMSSVCTHRGCPVGFDGTEVVCPCHFSRFDLEGRVTHAPAVQGLTPYATSYDPASGRLAIDLGSGDSGFPAWVAGSVTFTFAEFPQLQQEGGSVTGRPGGAPRPLTLLVVALGGGRYAALDAICTHLGCTVGFDAGAGAVVCPCHGSRYTTDGVVQQGPATRNLQRYDVASDAGSVVVRVPS